MKQNNSEWLFGIHTVQTLLKTTPQKIQRLLIQKKSSARIEKLLAQAQKAGIAVERVDESVLDDCVEGNHQGVCALCSPGEVYSDKWLYKHLEQLDHTPLLLILDGVTDPHNLGACLRTADAASVDAVIIPKNNSVGITPVVTKVACGAAESVPLIPVTNLARCMEKLQQMGIWITGTCDRAEQTLFDCQYEGPTALVMGAEDKGIRRLTREHCDQLVSIPMGGIVSSLNVSVATGVCLYEIQRQRLKRALAPEAK